MRMSAAGRQNLTERFEGCKLVAYPDPGTGGTPWSIGYGHTNGVTEGMTCTQAQADAWMEEDLVAAEHVVNLHVTVQINQHEFDALTDFVYNCGAANFIGSTLLKKLNAGDFAGAADEFDKWDHAAGKVMAGLLRRRQAETDMFKQGMAEVAAAPIVIPPAPAVDEHTVQPIDPVPPKQNWLMAFLMKLYRILIG